MKLTKKKIVLLVILLMIVINVFVSVINKQVMKVNDKKIKEKLNEIVEERIDYVFIEINPQFVFKIKNEIIEDIACMNDDCVKIYNELDVIGKDIKTGIDYVYNYVKDSGKFNVDKVKVKSNKDYSFENKNYISVEKISNDETNNLLKQVLNNEEIKEEVIVVEDYNTKLLNELKQDKDYGKYYDCNINNDELECYIKSDLLVGFTVDSADFTKYLPQYDNIIPNLNGINRVLNKFGIQTKGETELGLFYNPTYYAYVDGNKYSEFINGETYLSQYIYYQTRIDCSDFKFDLVKINLLDIANFSKYLYAGEDTVFEERQESATGDCGDKLCKWKVYVSYNTCDQTTQTIIYGEEIKETLYRICDANNNNCKNVPEEEFEDYHINGGYIYDAKVCAEHEPLGTVCRSLNGNKWEWINYME